VGFDPAGKHYIIIRRYNTMRSNRIEPYLQHLSFRRDSVFDKTDGHVWRSGCSTTIVHLTTIRMWRTYLLNVCFQPILTPWIYFMIVLSTIWTCRSYVSRVLVSYLQKNKLKLFRDEIDFLQNGLRLIRNIVLSIFNS